MVLALLGGPPIGISNLLDARILVVSVGENTETILSRLEQIFSNPAVVVLDAIPTFDPGSVLVAPSVALVPDVLAAGHIRIPILVAMLQALVFVP